MSNKNNQFNIIKYKKSNIENFDKIDIFQNSL